MKIIKKIHTNGYRKKTQRNLVSKLKRMRFNARNESWEIQELKYLCVLYKKHIKAKSNLAKSLIQSGRKVVLSAPVSIDYYQPTNYRTTNLFMSNITDCLVRAKRRVFIDFSATELISAAAMLSFLAQIETLISMKHVQGNSPISFSHPKSKKVKSILNQIGFYDLLNKPVGLVEEFEDVNFWHHTSGLCADPGKAKPMLDAISHEIKTEYSKKLYRGFIEAMANSVEHAYPTSGSCNKWWTFAGVKDETLVVVICDKGVGIPETLPHTQPASILRALLLKFNADFNQVKDSVYIRAATSLQNSSTHKKHRGKGLQDVMSVIRSTGTGYLSIFSNKGRYKYTGEKTAFKEYINDYTTSVNGTIIEWSIPLVAER
jgi:hypothetical protein